MQYHTDEKKYVPLMNFCMILISVIKNNLRLIQI